MIISTHIDCNARFLALFGTTFAFVLRQKRRQISVRFVQRPGFVGSRIGFERLQYIVADMSYNAVDFYPIVESTVLSGVELLDLLVLDSFQLFFRFSKALPFFPARDCQLQLQ